MCFCLFFPGGPDSLTQPGLPGWRAGLPPPTASSAEAPPLAPCMGRLRGARQGVLLGGTKCRALADQVVRGFSRWETDQPDLEVESPPPGVSAGACPAPPPPLSLTVPPICEASYVSEGANGVLPTLYSWGNPDWTLPPPSETLSRASRKDQPNTRLPGNPLTHTYLPLGLSQDSELSQTRGAHSPGDSRPGCSDLGQSHAISREASSTWDTNHHSTYCKPSSDVTQRHHIHSLSANFRFKIQLP